MFELSIVDIFKYIYKHLKLVVIFALLTSILGYSYANRIQSYTASIVIKYSYDGIESGLTPTGAPLDVYEITSPSLIENVIKTVNLNMNAENIRNNLSVAPLVDEETQEKIKAKTEKGEDYDYFPSEYIVSYHYAGSYGFTHGNFVLNSLMQEYENFFRTKYSGDKVLPDVLSTTDYSTLDYMEICDLFKNQIDQGMTFTGDHAKENVSFRSSATGLTFSDLQARFNSLNDIEYTKLLAIIKKGEISKNAETLIKRYQYKIEELQLNQKKKQNESDLALQKLLQFYREYKQYHAYNNHSGTNYNGGYNTGNNILQSDILGTENIRDFLTTYDDILLQYVNSGVEARSYGEDINYYQSIIDIFSTDDVPWDEKQIMREKADSLLGKIETHLKEIIELVNETASDYYKYKSGQQINYLSAVDVSAQVPVATYAFVSLFLGLFLALFLAITIELVRKYQRMEKESVELIPYQGLQAGSENYIEAVSAEELTVAKALVEDVKNDFAGFKLFFQPTVNTSGRWIGAEALLRWENHDLGPKLPNEFIEIAEKIGVMTILGEWVFRQACEQCRRWNEEIGPDFSVCVNFSIYQICSSTFIDRICEILNSTQVNPENIMIEISSRGEIEDLEMVAQKLRVIKSLGVKVSIDDFGTSTSSINLLHSFPLDIIKIDRQCIANLDSNKQMIISILDIAHSMRIKVCAEGIEDQEMARRVKALGIEYMQGYGFAKPVDAGNFTTVYRNAERFQEEQRKTEQIELLKDKQVEENEKTD